MTTLPPNEQFKRLENIPTKVYQNSDDASRAVATEIVNLILQKEKEGKKCVLGLATGSTPTGIYNELVNFYKEGKVSFKNVITFNLDEYYPMQPDALQSYVRFMKEYLFDHIDIPEENINVPDGTIKREDAAEYCRAYENKMKEAGGLDLQILGIGRTGHIGFNEPGSGIRSRTRMISLDHITIVDAASDFFGQEHVPLKALTMGVGSILDAKKIILMAWGEGKAPIIREAIEGPVTDSVPATYLQNHPNTVVILDEASSAELTRIKLPWTLGEVHWNEELIKKAVIWLSALLDKPILKLTNRDYSDNGMGDIITEFDTSYNINIKIFNQLQKSITGWPGGKPDADDSRRPERALPRTKKVVIFSPHPDDDVISMGGTFARLVDHNHEVHVAYQTSGNIAVFDDDVIRFADYVNDFHKEFGLKEEVTNALYDSIQEKIKNKKAGDVDSKEVQKIKGLIRKGEAKAGCRYIGIPDENAHFLNMPFYETGLVKKKPLGDEDIHIIVDLLRKIKPQQVYAAGDLSDPHGTHRVCLNAIFQALDYIIDKGDAWVKDCWVWLYRGAWQEWNIEDVEMAVPLSPDELLRKRKAIFKHQSQKDSALFPGHDAREFWQRSEDRNRSTASTYNQLGLAEYEAMEAFKRYYLKNQV